jgi:hypothetical protein
MKGSFTDTDFISYTGLRLHLFEQSVINYNLALTFLKTLQFKFLVPTLYLLCAINLKINYFMGSRYALRYP